MLGRNLEDPNPSSMCSSPAHVSDTEAHQWRRTSRMRERYDPINRTGLYMIDGQLLVQHHDICVGPAGR